MLEIKNLVKVYKTKGGAEVRALDGVSAKFGEKGMVFLLGKSGSGKSTLLNVCGGLDTPDEGEVIIMGRSSRDFTQSDFDSYRNTFVGFVFQEYNILNEFSVEDNIALALELQGKGRDRERVNDILKQVELENFAKRRPNTLSGGQKQRVAIARALVKNPQIIMADEPTGALDSETGRQVFETLKKLSADKLVIVVSHDREFAALYGDRIIELKDGRIISDVTKTTAAPGEGGNLIFTGGDTITVKRGADLTDEDVARINEFLRSAPKDLIISRDEREIATFRKAAKIGDDGAKEIFEATGEEDTKTREYTREESAFIRSRLPLRHAVKIGASSMKVKPFRLFFTILLSTISFAMFGLVSTMTFFDPLAVEAQSHIDSYYEELPLEKYYTRTTVEYEDGEEVYAEQSHISVDFTRDDLAAVREKYDAKALGIYGSGQWTNLSSIQPAGQSYDYYTTSVYGFADFDAGAWQSELLTDTDLNALGENDVIISSYTFESIMHFGLADADGQRIMLDEPRDIVGKKLRLNNGGSDMTVTVAGVYSNDPPDRFDRLKNETEESDEITKERLRLKSDTSYFSYAVALAGDAFYEAHSPLFAHGRTSYDNLDFINLYSTCLPRLTYVADEGYGFSLWGVNSLSSARTLPDYICFFDGREQASLAEDEMIISPSRLSYPIDMKMEALLAEAEKAPEAEREELENSAEDWYLEINELITALHRGYGLTDDGREYEYYTAEELNEMSARLNEELNACIDEGYGDLRFYMNINGTTIDVMKVAGYFYGEQASMNSDSAYLSKDTLAETLRYCGDYRVTTSAYSRTEDEIYSRVVLPMPSAGGVRDIVYAKNDLAADDTFFAVNSPITNVISSANSIIKVLWQIFLWTGVVLAVFSMLLLFNFISVSITYKKREIGILRAVGARSADVFKIFYSESAIITIICYILAAIASIIVCDVLNDVIAGAVVEVSVFVFGPLCWLVMLGIAAATSLVATFLPVYGIARRRPVDSIRAV